MLKNLADENKKLNKVQPVNIAPIPTSPSGQVFINQIDNKEHMGDHWGYSDTYEVIDECERAIEYEEDLSNIQVDLEDLLFPFYDDDINFDMGYSVRIQLIKR